MFPFINAAPPVLVRIKRGLDAKSSADYAHDLNKGYITLLSS